MLPALFIYSAGMAVNNTVAVFDAVFGKKSEFMRTPKYGITSRKDEWRGKSYNLPFTKTVLLEIFFVVYGIAGIFVAIFASKAVFVPIIAIQTAGFMYVAGYSIAHSRFKRDSASRNSASKMADRIYTLALVGIIAIILVGAVAMFEGYRTDVYPLDLSRGYLSEIIRESGPVQVSEFIQLTIESLPPEGNPVWLFPTSETDFGLMQSSLGIMRDTTEGIAETDRTSAAYHTGMTNVRMSAMEIRQNIVDATPYMYVSVTNILLGCFWMVAILGVFAVLKRKKSSLEKVDIGA